MMIESIGLALVKALATYLFKTYVLTQSKIHIDGAPSWYMKNTSSQVCVYEHQYGGYESVDLAKSNTYPKMQSELTNIVEAVIYDNFSNVKDPSERKFLMLFKNDNEAPVFIRKNLTFPAIEYDKSQRVAFVKACISNDDIINYQEGRLETIKYELTHKRAGDAFDEMESGDMNLE